MNLIIFLLILILFKSCSINCQQISCSYSTYSTDGYNCDLTIQNPNGFNGFTGISGNHVPGYRNNDVSSIGNSQVQLTKNVPSILCDTFQSTKVIKLLSSAIEVIEANSFRNCKNLEFLQLFNHKIANIDENSFNENLELQHLYLERNQLTTLPKNVFGNLHKLLMLVLNENKISDLPENIFNSLVNLEVLYLQSNLITTVKPKWFESLSKLRILNLNSNVIIAPSQNVFKQLNSLTNLDLNNNKIIITRFQPLWFEPLENLQELLLSQNKASELPRNMFSSLKKLVKLDLSFNNLKLIRSNSFGTLPNLSSISLKANQVEAIDEKIIDNTGLSNLNMLVNVCSSWNIEDTTASREEMRNKLTHCIDKYANSVECKESNFILTQLWMYL